MRKRWLASAWQVLRTVAVIGNVLALAYFLLASNFHPTGPNGKALDTFDAISLQVTVLTLAVGAVALLLAFAALVGYAAFKDIVIERAEKIIQEHVRNLPSTNVSETDLGLKAAPGVEASAVGKEGDTL